MTEDFPPFGFVTEQGDLTGIAVEMVQYIMNDLELDQGIQVLPWSRAMKRIETQTSMVLFSMARTSEREEKFRWVGPLLSDGVYLYKRRQSPPHQNQLEQAKSWRYIAVTENYPEHSFLLGEGFNNLWLTSNSNDNVRLLLGERVDAFVAGEFAVPDLLAGLDVPLDAIENTGIKVFDVDLYIAFSKETPDEVINQWQAALDKLKRSPDFLAIRHRYTQPN